MPPKYRADIKRSAKKKKPPGRKGKKGVNDSDSVVDFSTTHTDEDISTCSKKFKVDEDYIRQKRSIVEDNSTWRYLMLHTRILNNIVDVIGSCPSCSEKSCVFHNMEGKRGLAHFLEFSCTKCDWCTTFSTSEEVKKSNINNEDTTKSPGRHAFDINIRLRLYRFTNSLWFFEYSSSHDKKTFLETQASVESAYIKVAEANMNAAATEVRKVDGGQVTADEVVNTTISTDGTWQKRGYLTYIGDGDTKSYQNVVNANPYPGYEIVKAECVGHVQKRVGTRLWKFKTDCKELMPESFYAEKKDKKQEKLTFYLKHKMINRLQNYFGIAIRATCKTSVPTMRMAVGAVLFHCSEAVDSAGRHQFCPKSTISWCKYQVDQVNSMSDYIEKPGLPGCIA